MNKKLVLLLTVILLSLPITYTKAQDAVDISETPQNLANALNIPLFAGQLMTTALFMSFFVFPTMLLTNKKQVQELAVLFVGFTTMCVCIAIGWCPYWLLLILSLLVALLYGSKMKQVIGG